MERISGEVRQPHPSHYTTAFRSSAVPFTNHDADVSANGPKPRIRKPHSSSRYRLLLDGALPYSVREEVMYAVVLPDVKK